jgi:hypothetical protein
MNKVSHSEGGVQLSLDLISQKKVNQSAEAVGRFTYEIIRDGEVIETFHSRNLITNEGLTYKTGVALLGTTAITTWYLVPVDDAPTIAAGDTYASHAGWAEVENYEEATRQEWEGAAGAAGVATNSADRVEITISSGGADIGGMALVGGGSDPTVKGDTAGGGTLFSVDAFDVGDRNLQANDIFRITYQYTFANAS